MALRMFLPSPIGLADNGDGARLMCHLGVAPGRDGAAEHTFDNAVLDYGVPGARAASAAVHCVPYPSTTRLLMQVVQVVSKGLHLRSAIDLRVLMVLYCLVVAGTCAALCRLVGGRLRRQVVVAVGFFLIAADSVFVAYPGSPYTETAAIIGVLVLAPAAALDD